MVSTITLPRAASEPVFVTSQQKLSSRAAPVEACRSENRTTAAVSERQLARKMPDAEDPGAAEIRRIMQYGGNCGSPANNSWLGISPPTRTTGAANPLVQDFNWRSNAYRCSHSNLQALREIDARGVSFLRCSSQGGDSRLLVESPDYGLLSADDSQDTTSTTVCYVPPSRESCQATSAASTGHLRVGTPLSCQMGFFVR
ncbi:transcription factor NF-E2 [Coccomyxa subellipsoidea C-169]|uniref:Transcription factor NF-E2 n=2 Tax=Trebouxiophyceae TaxID=75966 RepID=I0YJI9_COCSC|nr:transcription factor NF-E2 [Coccomyxa subellipsoidea C-169]EIE18558.1 transcription factor NF-E2 [Coccomyxa subellipsoidea C-169]|eukprot:XP_005643102.1 transcription factor NF-E2 [Coccomyxa subellipsoidea C-169]